MALSSPAPLAEEVASRSTMLLGRINALPSSAEKPAAERNVAKGMVCRNGQRLTIAVEDSVHPLRPLVTPLHSVTSAAPFQWPFTPIDTPSPSCFGMLQQLHPGGALANAGPPAAAALGGRLLPPPSYDVQEEEEEEEEEAEEKDYESDGGAGRQPAQQGVEPPAGAEHPSVGSRDHASGACKRCCFFPRGRCANGYDCGFCHYDHEKPRRKNRRQNRKIDDIKPMSSIMAAPAAMYTQGYSTQRQLLQMAGAAAFAAQQQRAHPTLQIPGAQLPSAAMRMLPGAFGHAAVMQPMGSVSMQACLQPGYQPCNVQPTQLLMTMPQLTLQAHSATAAAAQQLGLLSQ